MPRQRPRLLFADSNVFIQDLFIPDSAASLVIDMVTGGSHQLCTCRTVVNDVERAILQKLSGTPDWLDQLVANWHAVQSEINLEVVPDATEKAIRQTYEEYVALMRHKNDIPVLAAALAVKPSAILSGNREHFNDRVAAKCGIPMLSCEEFLQIAAVL